MNDQAMPTDEESAAELIKQVTALREVVHASIKAEYQTTLDPVAGLYLFVSEATAAADHLRKLGYFTDTADMKKVVAELIEEHFKAIAQQNYFGENTRKS